MAEALGVISFGIGICQGVLTYYDAFRDSEQDIGQMCASMENVAKTLLAIDLTLRHGNFDQNIIAAVESSINLCTQGLQTLEKKLVKIRSTQTDGTLRTRLENTKRKLLYPFKESTLAKLREICHDLKSNLGLAIDALNVHAAFITQQRLDLISHLTSRVSKTVGSIATDIASVTTDIRSIRLEKEGIVRNTLLLRKARAENPQSLSTKVRQDNGAQQLLQHEQFKSWMTSTGTTLWCTGLPGIGKTINVSYIIEALRKLSHGSDLGIAYVYFSYKDIETQTPVNVMASILQQLISDKQSFLSDLKSLYAQHIKENTRPSVPDIVSLLQDVVLSYSKVFIIIDALDECTDADDVRFILLTELKKLQHRMCLLVMSRPIPDLEEPLEGATRVNVEASLIDIKNYLLQRLESTRSMQKHLAEEPSLRDKIVSVIVQKIKGMFLMARLYLDTLVKKTTRRKIKTALETLPEGLDSIYEELMNRVKLQNPHDHAELAMRVIGWIFYTSRPLTVIEMQNALAVEPGDTCLDDDGIPNRDLLVSEYFQRSGQRLLDHANRDIAATCLTYLHFDSFSCDATNVTSHDAFLTLLQNNPLLGYAAQHWGNHLRQVSDREINEQAIGLLNDINKVRLIAWLKEYADNLVKGTYFRPRTQVSGLTLASSFGLTVVASNLISSGSSLHERDSNGQTALHHAVENGHTDTAALLLDMGAEINSRDLDGSSPLHQASTNADGETAKLLILKGADVNAVDGYNATPLYRAAEVGDEVVTRLLLGANADLLVKNSYLQTALHRAADRGHLAVVDLLLKHGADVKAKDHYGYTPLYRAADQGHEDVERLLRAFTRRG
ncbi:hypothetical protein TRIATDRAFT_305868 [Trichoderma atroviride IMI 206040]|uniref:Nephrocystin 3-like N-terminal domain-containing protein n=1 Tax=Hypocrea atroviridis (strain ATCC 20476 / IMI 206040) TaxID=452589 RepID=G9NMJ4_HYPAI|nr:uncharacterized protein TRIATDRAFT_305868 [Trichoderma atroviride IMI 206040]EHK48124.1 hypothetical protein TRIATDRAFT_305868 [Trichoderma atroviride IMI 206040]